MTDLTLPDTHAWWGAQGWAPAGASLTSALPHLGVIAAEGPDAAAFLHGQLSQDVLHQAADEARLAAYCSAKGRMLASFLVLRPAPETCLLVVQRDVLPTVLKRLSMFVLRAKAKLRDASDELPLAGELTLASGPAPGHALSVARQPNQGWTVQLASVAGVNRRLHIGATGLAVGTAPEALAAWRWLDVMAGVPQIEPATSEQFVPQMVNFELLGGVNFKKGCYPGQEVVARSQYRGTTKRRAFVLVGSVPATPGAELFCPNDPAQPAGMVVNAAAAPAGQGHVALAELKLSAVAAMAEGASLHLGSPDGAAWSLGPQPISLPRAEEAE